MKCDHKDCKELPSWEDSDNCHWCDDHRHSLTARLNLNLYVKYVFKQGGFMWDWIAIIQNDGMKYLVPLLKDGKEYKIAEGMYTEPIWQCP